MRNLILAICFCSITVAAQSGRSRAPQPKPTPPKSRVNINVTEPISANKTPIPTPTPPVNTKETAVDNDENGVIRVDSVLVPIPVSVLDASGKAIVNLNLKDFALRVNGENQEIAEISRSESPVRLALLFDNSSSVTSARNFEKNAATKFFKRVLRSIDQASLYSVSTISRQEQKLTGDTRQLIKAINNLSEPQGATALFDGVFMASRYLREVNGRRVIVIVSDGVDTLSDSTLEETVKEAQLANCQIYVVKTTDFENFQITGQRGTNANLRDLSAERRMQELATQTGGTVYSPLDEKELDAAFIQIAAELSQQYILSYYPTETKRGNGDFKQIELRVVNKPNLSVRTRKGYYVPKI
ncbi:MAG: VWA domain-containing protein [Pyrinomonadaceae bacterium]|nr:VWA domain-containing protein [Pyrinomonadaceae bacterium]